MDKHLIVVRNEHIDNHNYKNFGIQTMNMLLLNIKYRHF